MRKKDVLSVYQKMKENAMYMRGTDHWIQNIPCLDVTAQKSLDLWYKYQYTYIYVQEYCIQCTALDLSSLTQVAFCLGP